MKVINLLQYSADKCKKLLKEISQAKNLDQQGIALEKFIDYSNKHTAHFRHINRLNEEEIRKTTRHSRTRQKTSLTIL